MTERITLLPNPPELSDEAAAIITEFLFDIAMAVELHYSHQLRRHYRNMRYSRGDDIDWDAPAPF